MNEMLRTEKKNLRQAILHKRDAISRAARSAASQTILEQVWGMPQCAQANVVLTYLGFGSEIETQPFFERIIASGKIAVLPRVDTASQSLVLHSVRSTTELVTSKWGIREPTAKAPIVTISAVDFVLVPGVAFDRRGNRLGYGRGYYDKLLSAVNPALARVSAAFSCQIVDRVPVDLHDQKTHCIITENEMITTSHDR
jgi:5-formyltetrahydrofolate cyclo-ligase